MKNDDRALVLVTGLVILLAVFLIFMKFRHVF